jgi:hypothetical protein
MTARFPDDMKLWSLRMTLNEQLALPSHLRPVSEEGLTAHGRAVAAFTEQFPLNGPMVVDPSINWQRGVFKILLARENILIREAEELRDQAVKILTRYREHDNRKPVNLGFVVRVRADTLGPRLDWVRFTGRSEPDWNGKKTSYSTPIKLRGKYRYSDRIFAAFPDEITEELRCVEFSAAIIRYEVDQLARLRQICREPTEPA